MGQPEFTAVVTCYFEEHSIDEFHARLSKALHATGRSFEIVMVNDGSTDRTYALLNRIFDSDPRVSCIVDMFKNYGQGAAIAAGVAQANGRHFIFMDSDLQLDPEELPLLLAEFDAGCDSVNGIRRGRRDSFFRRVASRIASIGLRRAADAPLEDPGCTFRIMHGNLIRGLALGPERVFNQIEIISKVGRHKEVPVTHHARQYGKSGWTFRKLFDFYMESLVNMSTRPFQALAAFVLAIACIGVLRVIVGLWVDFAIVPNVTNGLILNVVVIVGLFNLAVMALTGEFVIRSFRSTQGSPKYVIREVRRKADASGGVS